MTVKENMDVAIKSIVDNVNCYSSIGPHSFTGLDYKIFYHNEAYKYIINYLRNHHRDLIIEGKTEGLIPTIYVTKIRVNINSLDFNDELNWDKVAL